MVVVISCEAESHGPRERVVVVVVVVALEHLVHAIPIFDRVARANLEISLEDDAHGELKTELEKHDGANETLQIVFYMRPIQCA